MTEILSRGIKNRTTDSDHKDKRWIQMIALLVASNSIADKSYW